MLLDHNADNEEAGLVLPAEGLDKGAGIATCLPLSFDILCARLARPNATSKPSV
jgi:hypothetical protein